MNKYVCKTAELGERVRDAQSAVAGTEVKSASRTLTVMEQGRLLFDAIRPLPHGVFLQMSQDQVPRELRSVHVWARCEGEGGSVHDSTRMNTPLPS